MKYVTLLCFSINFLHGAQKTVVYTQMQKRFKDHYHACNAEYVLGDLPYDLESMRNSLLEAYPFMPDYRFNAYRDTALMFAADFCDEEVVQWLIDNNASLDATNCEGKTALMYAAQQARWHIVKILIKAGADEMLLSKEAKSAFDYVEADKDIFVQTVKAAKAERDTVRTARVELLRKKLGHPQNKHERDIVDDLTEPVETCCLIQ